MLNRLLVIGAVFVVLLSPLYLPGALLDEDFESPELRALAKEFRDWRRSFSEGILNYVDAAEDQKRGLETFRKKLSEINPHAWPVPAKVDYLVVLIEMNSLEFDLKIIREVSRNPDFYTTQAVSRVRRHIGGRRQGGEGVTVPYDSNRARAIVQALNDTPKIVEQAYRGLTEAVPEMADMAIEKLENIQQNYAEFAKVVGPHLPKPFSAQIGPAAEKAGQALDDYRKWLIENRPRFNAPCAIGRDAFDWHVRNVLVFPYNSDQLLMQAEMERHRNWMALQWERMKNQDLPRPESVKDIPTRVARDNQEYSEWKDATDVITKIWLEKYDYVTLPDYASGPQRVMEGGIWIEPFGLMAFPKEPIKNSFNMEFLVGPDHWFSQIYWEVGHRLDPATNHPHSNIPGHVFENAVSQKTCREIRRRHNTRGDSWLMQIEMAQLHLDYPFVRGPLIREWLYSLAIMRAERVYTSVKFADGSMKAEELPEHMMKTTPWMDPYVAKKHELWRKFTGPTYTLTYQVGPNETFKLIRDLMLQLGDNFNFREANDRILATGQIPISLARWEIAGIDEDCRHLWNNEPLPVKK